MNPNNETPQPVPTTPVTPVTEPVAQSSKQSVLPVFLFGLVFTLLIAGGVAYYLVVQTPQTSNAGSSSYNPLKKIVSPSPTGTSTQTAEEEIDAIDTGSIESDMKEVQSDLNSL